MYRASKSARAVASLPEGMSDERERTREPMAPALVQALVLGPQPVVASKAAVPEAVTKGEAPKVAENNCVPAVMKKIERNCLNYSNLPQRPWEIKKDKVLPLIRDEPPNQRTFQTSENV